jgi:hypothetical protein
MKGRWVLQILTIAMPFCGNLKVLENKGVAIKSGSFQNSV